MPEHTAASRLRLSGLCFLLQILNILLFAVFARYSPESSPSHCPPQLDCSQRNQDSGFQQPRFWDVHIQVLLSFGLLVAFLSRYGPGSAAISILIVAFTIQWAVLLQGFFYFFLNGKIYLGAQSMVSADFCTAAVLISTGAVLGRVNPVQMLLLALLEVTVCTLNEYILLSLMGVRDSGRSLTVHTFGAYFGLMVSRVLYQPHKDKRKREEQQDMGHQLDVFAVVGTIYLWIFWPSFTSATTVLDNAENWAALNTYFSLVASTVATFILSPVLYEESTPRMPVLHSRLKIQDTCGVHNIHGLPGILGALLGTLLTLLATADTYGDSTPSEAITQSHEPVRTSSQKPVPSLACRLELVFPLIAQGSRTITDQALIQLSALPLTLLLAALGGCLTGAVLKTKVLRSPPDAQYLENTVLWEVAEERCDPRAGGKELGISTLV
ncbi:ammonium transporter Rh type B isoform 3-T3 [Cyanocitta cristata]